jgi:hypothetical protein
MTLKSLKRLAQETEVSKSSASREIQLLKLRLYKIEIHTLQPCNPANRVHFCNWFLQSVIKGEIDPQLTFSSNEAWFHLQGYINTQNNRYWNSKNPHLTMKSCSIQWKFVSDVLYMQEGFLHPCFLTKQLIAKDMYRWFSENSFWR